MELDQFYVPLCTQYPKKDLRNLPVDRIIATGRAIGGNGGGGNIALGKYCDFGLLFT